MNKLTIRKEVSFKKCRLVSICLQRVNIRDPISEAVLCCTVRRGAWPQSSGESAARAARTPPLRIPSRWWKESGAGVICLVSTHGGDPAWWGCAAVAIWTLCHCRRGSGRGEQPPLLFGSAHNQMGTPSLIVFKINSYFFPNV